MINIKSRLESNANSVAADDVVSYIFILLPTFLMFLMTFMLGPLSSQVLLARMCDFFAEDDCDSSVVSAQASLLGIWTSLAQSIPAFLFSGYYASLSDRFGRKFILFIPVLGLTIYATVLLFIDVSHPQSFQVIVIVGSLISGCSGLYLVFIMGAYSYVSDATRFLVDDRKFAYSITQAAIVAPKIISPVIGGLLASEYGFAIPLCLIIGLGITAGICILIIPESLPVDSRARLKPLQFDVVKTFSNIKMLFTQKANAGTGTSPLGFVCSAFFLHFWCVVGNALLLVFYVKRRFGWSPSTIGYFEGLDGAVDILSMLFVPYFIHFIFGTSFSMSTWLLIGLFGRMIFWFLISFSSSTEMMFASLPVLLLVGSIPAYTRAIISNSVPHNMQASVFSGLSGIESCASMAAPIFSAGYYFSVTSGLPGLMYQIMGLILFVAFLLVCYARYNPSISSNFPDAAKLSEIRQYSCDSRALVAADDNVNTDIRTQDNTVSLLGGEEEDSNENEEFTN